MGSHSKLGGTDPKLMFHVLEGKFDGFPQDRNQAKAAQKMDKHLWSQLSDDLLKKVFLRLPYASRCRFRAVSKTWSEILSSTSFTSESEVLPSTRGEPSPICAYDYSCPCHAERWMEQSRPVGSVSRILKRILKVPRGSEGFSRRLSDKYDGSKPKKMDFSFAPAWISGSCNKIKACRDGLLCFEKYEEAYDDLNPYFPRVILQWCVFNPFNRTWRELPPLPELIIGRRRAEPLYCEVMIDSAAPSHFLVYSVMYTRHDRRLHICQYSSSKSNDWFMIPGDPESPLEYEEVLQVPPHAAIDERVFYYWYHQRLNIYSLENGKLLTVVTPGDPVQLLQTKIESATSGRDHEALREKLVIIVAHKGTTHAVICPDTDFPWDRKLGSGDVIGISRLGADMRWEEPVMMPEWAIKSSRVREFASKLGKYEYWDQYFAAVAGDYICVNLGIENLKERKVLCPGPRLTHWHAHMVSQCVVGFHIPSQTWKSFGLHVAHGKGVQPLKVFVPRCLQVCL